MGLYHLHARTEGAGTFVAPKALAWLWRCSKTQRSLKDHSDLNVRSLRSLRSSRVLSKNPRGGRGDHRPCKGGQQHALSRAHLSRASKSRVLAKTTESACDLLSPLEIIPIKCSCAKKTNRRRVVLIALDGPRQKILGGSGSMILRAGLDDP